MKLFNHTKEEDQEKRKEETQPERKKEEEEEDGIEVKIESSLVLVEMSNTYSDKFLMSILFSPPPSAMLSRINCSPERYQSQDKRWFKVTTVVLQKKGKDFYLFLQSFISITRLA